jgi:hypothetical protein
MLFKPGLISWTARPRWHIGWLATKPLGRNIGHCMTNCRACTCASGQRERNARRNKKPYHHFGSEGHAKKLKGNGWPKCVSLGADALC